MKEEVRKRLIEDIKENPKWYYDVIENNAKEKRGVFCLWDDW